MGCKQSAGLPDIYWRFQNLTAPTIDSVSDDEPLSLDFTIPSAAPAPAPAPTVRPAEPPAAPPVAPLAMPDLPAALVEAAVMHANGNDMDACRRLEAALKGGEPLGDHVDALWLSLFELLGLLNRRPAFESLGKAYTKRFQQAPPAWPEPVVEVVPVVILEGGRAQMTPRGCLSAASAETLKKLVDAAQSSPSVLLDLGKLTDADDAGCALLRRALQTLRKAGKECHLGNPQALAALVATHIEMGQRSNEAMWLLLLDLYQYIGMQEPFEENAINYAVTFEVSPASWDPGAVRPSEVQAVETGTDVANGDEARFSLRGQILGAGSDEFSGIDQLAKTGGDIEIDAGQLVRIDIASVDLLRSKLEPLKNAGRHIVLNNLSALTTALLVHREFASIADLVTRRG